MRAETGEGVLLITALAGDATSSQVRISRGGYVRRA